ncbi:cysteine desulfurase family protein [Streptosporangium longisporum]|uniref:Cysteine desulfurase/sulfurtransferase TusA family protein n=1 Tax=Streptosporangium longisporum TaxID=46187 RepID=A0ABP6KL88_9ACTN
MAYFDAASTEPLHPQAREALIAALDVGWADPARLYGSARRARMLLEQARTEVAEALGARPDEVSFTSSGTQAVHLGVLGTLHGRRRAGRRLVTSAVEHSSVLHAAGIHERDGGAVETVGVGITGAVEAGAFAEAAGAEGTALACLQSANHEVGTLQPVAEVAEACAGAGVPLLVDAAQTAGRMPLPGGWSVLAASAHKWGGPAGVGILVVRKGTRWRSPLPDDDRERRRVPGFENVPAIVAAAAALRATVAESAIESARIAALVDRIRTEVARTVPDVEVIGDPVARAPHIVTFSCLYVEGEALLTELDRAGFSVSSGSSCTASTLRPSHVLEAMGVLTHGNVRVSLPRGASATDVDRFLSVLPDVVRRIREEAGVKL